MKLLAVLAVAVVAVSARPQGNTSSQINEDQCPAKSNKCTDEQQYVFDTVQQLCTCIDKAQPSSKARQLTEEDVAQPELQHQQEPQQVPGAVQHPSQDKTQPGSHTRKKRQDGEPKPGEDDDKSKRRQAAESDDEKKPINPSEHLKPAQPVKSESEVEGESVNESKAQDRVDEQVSKEEEEEKLKKSERHKQEDDLERRRRQEGVDAASHDDKKEDKVEQKPVVAAVPLPAEVSKPEVGQSRRRRQDEPEEPDQKFGLIHRIRRQDEVKPAVAAEIPDIKPVADPDVKPDVDHPVTIPAAGKRRRRQESPAHVDQEKPDVAPIPEHVDQTPDNSEIKPPGEVRPHSKRQGDDDGQGDGAGKNSERTRRQESPDEEDNSKHD